MSRRTIKRRQRCHLSVHVLLAGLLVCHGTVAHGQASDASAEGGEATGRADGPALEFEDGELVIDRDGVETVVDSDDASATAVDPDADPDIEQIVVLGIRRALEGALEEKRQTPNLTDVINAENIGKLPDENVAEVLENIPGVQITRDAGIGAAVSIRGSDENRVEIDGRGTLSDGDDRGGIRFADLPAALVRSLTVTKVPTADMVEGSIGGTINVKTFRGLKLKEPLVVGNLTGEYADNADAWNQNYSGTLGDKFESPIGDIGAILTLSRIEKTVREDILRVSPALRPGPGEPINRTLFPPIVELTPYYYPGFSDTTYGTEERENTTASGSLEWQMSDSIKLFAEGTYTHVETEARAQSAFASYGTASTLGCRNPPCARDNRSDRELDGLVVNVNNPEAATFGLTSVAGGQVPIMTSGRIGGGIRNGQIDPANPSRLPDDGLQIRPSNRTGHRDTDSFLAAVGGEWIDDDWLVELEASASASDSTTDAFITTFQYNDPDDPDWDFHSGNARIRVPFLYDVRDDLLSYGPVPGTPTADELLNPEYYSLFVSRDTTTRFNNDLYAQRLDVGRFLDNPVFSEVGFGFRSSQRSTKRKRESITTDTFPGLSGTDLESYLVPTPGNFFDFNKDGVYLDDFLTPDAKQVGALRQELIRSAGLGTNDRLAPPQGFEVDEDTYAGYLRLDFDTELLPWPIKGNFGVRFVRTNQTAKGNQLNPDQTFSPVSVDQNYDNWLPSVSVVAIPVEDVQLRFGYARILRRPSFAQLAPTFEFPLNEGQAVIVGDPNLQPTTADQVDLGIEWYFRKGSVFSVGYFYKNLNRVIGTEFKSRTAPDAPCNPIAVGDLTNPPCPNGLPGVRVDEISWVNLPGGQIQGVEIAFQHNFNYLPQPLKGFGVIANYAYQHGERDDTIRTPQPLRETLGDDFFPLNFRRLSEHSYNVTAYFEKPKYGFSGRVRYTWRSGFLISESVDVSNGLPLYREARGQLNASLSLRLPKPVDQFTLILWGVNLTKEQGVERAAFPGGPVVRVKDADRRLAIGVRARF